MAYEATIASAGGDGLIMAKSFIVACEGPVANWYSHQPSCSITSWPQLKAMLKQDFQGFGRLDPNTIENFQFLQGDKEFIYDYFRRFVQKKAPEKRCNRQVHRRLTTRAASLASVQGATQNTQRPICGSRKVRQVRCRPQTKGRTTKDDEAG